MKAYQRLKDKMSDFYRQFSEHPYKTTGRTAWYLVKNCWDVIPAVAAGLAFDDTGSKIFGEWRASIMVLAPAISIAGTFNNYPRFERNMEAGLGTLLYFWTNGMENVSSVTEIGTEAAGIVIWGLALASEADRIKKRRAETTEMPSDLLKNLTD